MAVTLADIAREAHVSISTVSRALSDYPHVNDQTREAVLRCARALNYPLHGNHRANASPQVVYLCSTLGDHAEVDADFNWVGHAIALGAEDHLARLGAVTRRCRARPADIIDTLLSSEPYPDGLVVGSSDVSPELLAALQAHRLPFVVAGSRGLAMAVNCVMADYAGGMEQAVGCMAAGGRRHIALVNGPADYASSLDKQRGYRLALALHGLNHQPELEYWARSFAANEGYVVTQRLLAARPDVDAIAYANDPMAIGGMGALREAGRDVPADVAVTGFYDYETARYAHPALTTVHFDLRKIGEIAARRLLLLLQEPEDAAWCVTVPTTLVARASSGAMPDTWSAVAPSSVTEGMSGTR